ncbi:MAG: hypothetical protein KatS3mg110_3496 [Pirellulaceae bacterium]|nr:MAG: hypothetical protein KatS3mg110_3496 [Pirellulaceae bacterium]
MRGRRRHTPGQMVRQLCDADGMLATGRTVGGVCTISGNQ